jgi:hypothetical protein
MATTCNNVQYDIKAVDEFLPKLGIPRKYWSGIIVAAKMGLIQRDRLFELVIAHNSEHLEIDSRAYLDLSDGSDVKSVVSNFACDDKRTGKWSNVFSISKVAKKVGDLRCVCYNKQLNKYHYFKIPYDAYRHITHTLHIYIETWCGYKDEEPIPTGNTKIKKNGEFPKWWEYECTFAELCQ